MNRVALAAAVLACALGARAEEPVAFVADVQGNATIEGDGAVRFLGELPAGMRLLVASNARVVVTYVASGAEYTARGPGEFSVKAAELVADRGAAPAHRQVSALKTLAPVRGASKTAMASVRMRGARPAEPDVAPSGNLSAEARARIARSKANAKTFSARVSHALLLEELGATHEAREAWAELAHERPDLPELAALQH